MYQTIEDVPYRERRAKGVGLLLNVFFYWTGADMFYMGKKWRGIFMLSMLPLLIFGVFVASSETKSSNSKSNAAVSSAQLTPDQASQLSSLKERKPEYASAVESAMSAQSAASANSSNQSNSQSLYVAMIGGAVIAMAWALTVYDFFWIICSSNPRYSWAPRSHPYVGDNRRRYRH